MNVLTYIEGKGMRLVTSRNIRLPQVGKELYLKERKDFLAL
jgi:hypothetical protein